MKTIWLAFALAATGMFADELGDRVSVPFSDPSKPGTVKVSLIAGGITVKGYAGKEVMVEAHSRDRERHRDRERTDGLHRIDMGSSGLSVEEVDNVVQIGTRSYIAPVDLTIQVPYSTSLKLGAINDGEIVVEHVNGEIDVNNTNGGVKLTNISGSAVAHALNGNVVVTFDKVTPGKTMSFSSLNGEINVTLPPDLKARVKVKSDNGEVYSDFDIKMDAGSQKLLMEENGSHAGKYRVRFDRGLFGTINGGGAEMQFTNFNGNIYIRKGK